MARDFSTSQRCSSMFHENRPPIAKKFLVRSHPFSASATQTTRSRWQTILHSVSPPARGRIIPRNKSSSPLTWKPEWFSLTQWSLPICVCRSAVLSVQVLDANSAPPGFVSSQTRKRFGFPEKQASNNSPTPGNATVKGTPVAGMKNLGIRFRTRVRDHIDGGRVVLICARDVSCPNIIPEGVIELEQFITNPRAIKRQLPLKPRILSASSDFDGPCMLRRQRRVNHAGIRTLSKVDQIVQRRRLPTTTDIHECLCLAIDFVNRAQLGIESPKILPI